MFKDSDFEVDVEHEVIKWLVDSSGYTTEKLSEQFGTGGENTIKEWIEGKKKPTEKQLEYLAKYLKRPLAAFFLPKPPEEKPRPKDYRMLPGKEGKFDPKTLLAIRTARRLQKISKELAENLDNEIKQNIFSADLTDNPKKIAERYRNIFQITDETQKNWKTPRDAFKMLRESIEKRNILVFQIPMPMEDARGFALSDDTPCVIVVNSKEDLIEARLFTLMHEFAHILLNKSGIDIPENSLFIRNNQNEVEKWCNEFASEFLLPEKTAMEIFTKNKRTLTASETLNTLKKRYKVSKFMLLYNMRKLSYITDIQVDEVVGRYKPVQKESKKTKRKPGGPAPDVRCLSEKGKKFISLVSKNLDKNFITERDALDYLSIKSTQYNKILSKIRE